MIDIKIGDKVSIKHKFNGIVKYVGPIEGKDGNWVGINLDKSVGRNNGTIIIRNILSVYPREEYL